MLNADFLRLHIDGKGFTLAWLPPFFNNFCNKDTLDLFLLMPRLLDQVRLWLVTWRVTRVIRFFRYVDILLATICFPHLSLITFRCSDLCPLIPRLKVNKFG